MIKFEYNKNNARCTWCKRTKNPHPDFDEPIPTKVFLSKKRRKIGRYLLPPDTKKGYKHHRGILSMPSSEIENPYKLASPYEFFIVQKKDGAYHLDKNYTAFGKVINGMNVVDLISNLETDKREWPLDNVRFNIEIIE